MFPLFILIYPFLEIYAFYLFMQQYGFWNTVLFVILSGILGLFILSVQGRTAILRVQQSFAGGSKPANEILHQGVILVGAFLIMAPGIVSDIVGLLCILPISRHIIVAILKFRIAKGLFSGGIRVFNSGFGFGTGPEFQQPRQHNNHSHQNIERDVTVVDVTPIEVTHQIKKEDN